MDMYDRHLKMINDKIMNTPYQILRNKNKIRKQQLHKNHQINTPQLSIGSNTRAKTTHIQANNKKSSITKRIRNIKSQNTKFRINKLTPQPSDNYQVIIKNAMNKTGDIRFTFTKSGESKSQEKGTSQQRQTSKKHLHVTGTHCGRDLIKLNRKKLEELISKIEGNQLQKIGSQPIPEIVIKKCKDLRKKIDKSQDSQLSFKTSRLAKDNPKQSSNKQAKYAQSTSIGEQVEPSIYIQSIPERFDARQFLKCCQINRKTEEDEAQDNSFSFVLNNNKITNFIKQSKKKKSGRRRSRLHQDIIQGAIQQNNNIYSSRQVLNFQHSKKQSSIIKSHSPRRMNHSFGNTVKITKAKINAINFKNLDGWQGEQSNPEVNLMNPSFLC